MGGHGVGRSLTRRAKPAATHPLRLPGTMPGHFGQGGPIALAHTMRLGGNHFVAKETRTGKRDADLGGSLEYESDILQSAIQRETNIVVEVPGANLSTYSGNAG
jgi:hypothetical protein